MKRRQFIKYTSLGAAGFSLAACSAENFYGFPDRSLELSSRQRKPNLVFGNLEKTQLNIGIVSVTDAAALAIAKEQGFFERYGLNVNLIVETSWQGIQEGLIRGRLDAAQAPYGMPLAAQLGAEKAPMLALMVLNLNGSAITLSQKAWEAGMRPSIDYLNFQEFRNSYRRYINGLEQPPVLGVEFPSSMQNYNTRYWLSAMNIDPDNDVQLSVIPPTQMVQELKAGRIDGYCVSEPWNQQAVLEQVGFTAFVDRDIWQGHPEKVLATMQPWVEQHPVTARALVAAVLKACRYCDRIRNRENVIQTISNASYLKLNRDAIATSFAGNYNYGGFDRKTRMQEIRDLHLFHHKRTDYLGRRDRANYPWRSHAVWVLTQMVRWNQIDRNEYPKDADQILDRTYPVEIYEEVAKALDIPVPKERMKVEPAEAFIDQWEFDPSEPVAYLSRFDIRAGKPQIFALS